MKIARMRVKEYMVVWVDKEHYVTCTTADCAPSSLNSTIFVSLRSCTWQYDRNLKCLSLNSGLKSWRDDGNQLHCQLTLQIMRYLTWHKDFYNYCVAKYPCLELKWRVPNNKFLLENSTIRIGFYFNFDTSFYSVVLSKKLAKGLTSREICQFFFVGIVGNCIF